jgi:transposase
VLELLSQHRQENKRLKMEKEILKKAAIFFAKETK